ncbi:MAG: sulfate permease [Betaproteobacteria bacterium]
MKRTLLRMLPSIQWIKSYSREDFSGDLVAGIITAILLVPQGMAFGILAGLPAQAGLYASILPPIVYAIFGTSRTLAVGPVSVAAIMVAQTLASLPETVHPLNAALTMAVLSGGSLLIFGCLRFGKVANFMSHSVLSGFTNAAAILIILSQLPNLIGFSKPQHISRQSVTQEIELGFQLNSGITLLIGLLSVVFLVFCTHSLINLLSKLHVPRSTATLISRAAPLGIVCLSAVSVSSFNLENVKVVGSIPAGLPQFELAIPSIEVLKLLLIPSILIALIGYVESISIAKTLANRHRQKIDTNQELIALGAANLSAGISGGMPVAGGFSRTMVNYAAGAKTQLAAIITAILVGAVALFFTPLLQHIPKAALAAIIIVAVTKLIDIKGAWKIWRYDRIDGLVLLTTTIAVLFLGIETGLAIGVGFSLTSLSIRAAKPHVAVMGRVPRTEHFRNILRHDVETWPHLLFIRVDENLTFANVAFLETLTADYLVTNNEVKHIIFVFSSVNIIDSSALEVLERMIETTKELDVTIHLSDVKGPVMDKLKTSHLIELLRPGGVYLSANEAAETLK